MTSTCKGDNKSRVFLAPWLAAAVIFFPLSFRHVDFRSSIHEALSIAPYKSSPAYAAFEDLHEDYKSSPAELAAAVETLASGSPAEIQLPKPIEVRRLALNGLTIQAPAVKFQFHENQTVVSAPSNSVGELAEKLATQALEEQSGQNERIIRSVTGSTIVVRRPDFNPVRIAAAEPAPRPAPAEATNDEPATFQTLVAANTDPMSLSGQIELTGGLPFIGDRTPVTVRRIYNGISYEQGRVWTHEGKFEIRIKKPVGYLVAELKTENGAVLGRGELSLVDLASLEDKRGRIQDLRLALHPVTTGASFTTTSGRSPITQASVDIQDYSNPTHVNDEGALTDPTLMPNSTFVARAQAAQHWSSMVVGQTHDTQNIRLFSKSVIQALVDLNASGPDQYKALHSAIVWGEVLRHGQPLKGAVVQMAQQGSAIYFDAAYLPDQSQTVTGSNGLFAFINVEPGVQTLRVEYKGKVYPAQVLPTEQGMVSYVELNVKDKAISHFRVFDALNINATLPARLHLLGNDKALDVHGDDYVEYAMAADPFVVEADGGMNYEISRATVTGTPEQVFIPLVKREWLTQMMSAGGFIQDPARGTIVGLVDDQDFSVGMTGYGSEESAQIVYFDSHGQPVKSQAGVAGGGFVIFNAPVGLQTVYIHPTQSRQTYSQVVMPEAGFVQVLTH